MKSTYSYLITISGVAYWIFRIVVSLMSSLKLDFICEPYNTNVEIAILFLTIPCILLIIRRNVIASLLYFGMYGAYFGTLLYNDITATNADFISVVLNALGVIIPFLIFLDVAIQKSGIAPEKNESDWYYNNEKYDRKFDKRADRNEYKIK